MNKIRKRPFMILSDFMDIYQFMIDIYEKDWRNGVPAPFFEYALSSEWSDKTMSHRNMIWETDNKIVGLCCWKGFNHEEEGPWDGDLDVGYHMEASPHATSQYDVAIQNEVGEYVCWAGMWWTPGNHLAYMEPLCTVPEYRHKGLAAAALSEMYKRMKPLGATHMTGGGNPFYKTIGYEPMITWTYWKK